jgi:hypothetical protein
MNSESENLNIFKSHLSEDGDIKSYISTPSIKFDSESGDENLNMFQKKINEDNDIKSSYISSSALNFDSDSESDAYKIVIPKNNRKKNIDTTSQELLFQLLKQHKKLLKTQKRMYKLQSEFDKEEIKGRYVKLDLNNAQVSVEESKEKLKINSDLLFKSRVENCIWRVSFLLHIVIQIYLFVLDTFYSEDSSDKNIFMTC